MSALPPVVDVSDDAEHLPQREGIRWYGMLLFIGQLALLALAAWSLYRIDGGWLGVGVAIVLVVVHVLGWIPLMAPGSTRRLHYRERLLVNLVDGVLLVAICALNGLWLPALVALSFAVIGDALDSRR